MSEIKSNILGAMLSFFLSIALFRLVIYIMEPTNYARAVEASLGVTTGHPVWRTFQSRVLGPYIIKMLSFELSDYITAHVWFNIATIGIAAFLSWRMGRKYGGNDQSALLGLTIFGLSVALLLSPPDLYSWDFIDIIVFLIFIDLVLSNASPAWFLLLFIIAIWNRDSANFIAVWLILDALIRFLYARQQKPNQLLPIPFDWWRLGLGLVCVGIGLILPELLKQNLVIEEMAPKLYPNSLLIPFSASYNTAFLSNMQLLKESLTHPNFQFWFIVPAFWVLIARLGLELVLRDAQRYLALYLVQLALLVALQIFAVFNETRVYLILVPFVVIYAVLLSHSSSPSNS